MQVTCYSCSRTIQDTRLDAYPDLVAFHTREPNGYQCDACWRKAQDKAVKYQSEGYDDDY